MYSLDLISNSIIHGNCLTELQKIPKESIDLIFADPPYFMQTEGSLIRTEGTKFSGVEDDWDKFEDYQHYDEFCHQWLKECYRILKPNGSIWVIGAFQNIYRIGHIMQNLNFWILNDVVWYKTNPTPNFKGTRFTNANETLLWCTKSKSAKYTFNYKTMKHLNGQKQMKSIWEIGLCIGNERIKNQDGTKAHSTQKPEKLLLHVILSSSKVGDTVLDPFMGSGTTAAIAKLTGRNYIGIEQDLAYINIAEKRLKNIVHERENPIFQATYDVKPPKVSILNLIEKNYLTVGETFYNHQRLQPCKLCENGYLKDDEEQLSIHKMSAKKLQQINHNGWEFWYVMRNNNLISIDELRIQYRKEVLHYE